MYIKPIVMSYEATEIYEKIGPCQNAAYLDVGGGRQVMLGADKIKYCQECISSETKIVHINAKNEIVV